MEIYSSMISHSWSRCKCNCFLSFLFLFWWV